ncbi:MAG: hypothetical protein ACYDHY_16450 [Acidiferrobacterales bacterium]
MKLTSMGLGFRKSTMSKLIGIALAVVLAVGTATAWAADADETSGGYGPGYGMMGGYGGYIAAC